MRICRRRRIFVVTRRRVCARAAGQLLLGGRISRGVSILEPVFAELDMHLPRSATRALTVLLPARAKLLLQGLHMSPVRPVAAADAARLEALWAAASGLAGSQPIVGAALHAQFLELALKAGDPQRACEALMMEGFFSAFSGGYRARHRTQQAIVALRRSSKHIDAAEARCLIALADAYTTFFEGRNWERAHEALMVAQRITEDAGKADASWVSHLEALRYNALYWMGRPGTAARELPAAIQRADERGNKFVWSLMMLVSGWASYCRGDVDEGRRLHRVGLEPWKDDALYLPFWWRTLADYAAHMRQGNPCAAFESVDRAWPKLRKGLIVNQELYRIEARSVRARAALGCARHSNRDRAQMLRVAECEAARIHKEEVPWAKGVALSLRGAAASIRGDHKAAQRHLADAEPVLEAASLEMVLAFCRRGRGSLLGGDEGQALVDTAGQWFDSQGVKEPEQLSVIYLPGSWDR